MSETKNFGINLNFDSLGEAYGWPSGFKDDKAFTKGLDRITDFCRKLDIPITIFIVGKDLENKKNHETRFDDIFEISFEDKKWGDVLLLEVLEKGKKKKSIEVLWLKQVQYKEI